MEIKSQLSLSRISEQILNEWMKFVGNISYVFAVYLLFWPWKKKLSGKHEKWAPSH